ncbi:hypothetical protein [Amycolatopsis sp. RTGN1]|uniref:hypothetical protein n=1 Tax=Amycolatopsis ponsaeliensis TaxID=2992142 RepID=UPI00254A202C|nr:hypothetical protein [Amycolatopsis sp. RTGN1]
MDTVSAAAITSLLVSYGKHLADIASDTIDEGVKRGLRALWEKVRSRFSGDEQASGALTRLVDQPENQRRQAAVEDHLDELMSADSDFAAALAELVDQVKLAGYGTIQVRDAGAVAVGGNVSIKGTHHVAGRDVIIGTGEPAPGS